VDVKDRSIDPAARFVLLDAHKRGIATAWDRLQALEPLCGFGELGVCCDCCYMGPCRIDPFGDGAQVGVCGATADLIVARNLARAVASGAAAHSDHGREVVGVLRATTGRRPGTAWPTRQSFSRWRPSGALPNPVDPFARSRATWRA